MEKSNQPGETKQHGGVTIKHDKNAGSGAFNQGSEQDPHFNEGVADGTPHPDKVSKEKENPRSGRVQGMPDSQDQ